MPVNTDIMSTAMIKSNTCKFLCNRTCKTHIYHICFLAEWFLYTRFIGSWGSEESLGECAGEGAGESGREIGYRGGGEVYFQTGKHMLRPVSVSIDDCLSIL